MASNPTPSQLPMLRKYEVLDKLAEGGFGAVYRGRHLATGRLVAIKIIPQDIAEDSVQLKRLEQEFLVASRLDHPNIVRALDFGQEAWTHYLVMELVQGMSLGQRIEAERRVPEAEAIRIICQAGSALQFAHEHGLIHRDIKPNNILLAADGHAKLTDFGIVKETKAGLTLTEHNTAMGTPNFMAPEQFSDARNVTVRSDIYSLAATLYNAVTGELPFRGNGRLAILAKKINNDLIPPRELVPAIGLRLERTVLRALSVDPQRRYASCHEFLKDLTGQSSSGVFARPAVPVASMDKTRHSVPRLRATASARFRRPAEPPTPLQRAILVSISTTGLEIVVPEAFKIGDAIEIEIVPTTGRSRLRPAEVCWVRSQPDQLSHHLGCGWKQPLTADELQHLV